MENNIKFQELSTKDLQEVNGGWLGAALGVLTLWVY